jgi:starch phosphorylase
MGSDERLYEPRVNPFPTGTDVDGGLRRYEGWVEAKRAGAIGYTVRVVPHHPLLASPAEMGLATLPAVVTPPPSGDYTFR